jgi:hypothetical protein
MCIIEPAAHRKNIWQIAKLVLATKKTCFGRTMCMFVVFARKDGASQLIGTPKRTPTRFIPPLCFLLACFGVLSRPRGVKNTPKQPAQRSRLAFNTDYSMLAI